MSRRRSRVPATFTAHERRFGLFLPARLGFKRDERTGEFTERVVAALPVKAALLKRPRRHGKEMS
jgi:hypothetical protein